MSSTPYDRQTSFALYSAENPGEPHSGATLDAEFNAVQLAIDDTQQNLAKIQDDDGAVKRGSIGKEQFDASVSIGFGAPSQWATGHIYTADVDTVFYQSKFYIAKVTHTSGVSFAPANWTEIADFTAAAVIADGSITSAKLATGAVTADKIGDGSISNAKLATGSVTTTKIADEAVTLSKFVSGLTTQLANIILPAGLGPLPWTGSTAPAGWVLCYGQSLLRASYPDLWTHAQLEIIAGNALYTNGNGTTTFTVPDMRGRGTAGKDDMGGSALNVLNVTLTGTKASTSTGVITGLSSTAGLAVGMKAFGTGIGASAAIASIDSGTQVTLSVNNTTTGSVSIRFGVVDGATLGATGGAQVHAQTLGQVPTGITSAGTATGTATPTGVNVPAAASGISNQPTPSTGGNNVPFSGATFSNLTGAQMVVAATASVTSNNTGGQSHPNVQPTVITNYILKAH